LAGNDHIWGIVELDGNQIYESKISHLSSDEYLVGYVTRGMKPVEPVSYTYLADVSAVTTTGDHQIEVYADGADLKLDIDGVNVDTDALGGASVSDNDNDYLLFNYPFWDYYKHTVGGVEVCELQPNFMIGSTAYSTGTATFTQGSDAVLGFGTIFTDSLIGGLIKPTADTAYYIVEDVTDATHLTIDRNYIPATATGVAYGIFADRIQDRDNYTYYGEITWGYNTSIGLSYGEMESYESTSAIGSAIINGTDMPTSSMPSTWFGNGSNVANLPFYDSFIQVSLSTGQPVQSIYFLAIIGLAIGSFLLLTTMTRSALLGALGFNIVLFVGSSMTVVPMWIPFVCMICMFGIMYLYRQVAY
jgi:hypothetical protein